MISSHINISLFWLFLTSLVYDAVLLWAYGVNKTLEQGYSPNDGLRVTQNIFNMTFEGMTGTVRIDEKGDRQPNYVVQMVQDGKLVPLMEWIATEKRMQKLYKPDDPSDWSGLIWPGNSTTIPLDSPPCGWENERCEEETQNATVIIISVCCVIVLFLLTGIFIGIRKIR